VVAGIAAAVLAFLVLRPAPSAQQDSPAAPVDVVP
jgi:hypothetical protein